MTVHCDLNVSSWYLSLGAYTFPTVFVPLPDDARAALAAGRTDGLDVLDMKHRLHRGLRMVPGNGFVHADACAPTDSPLFQREHGAVASGDGAWQMLVSSSKVREAADAGATERLALHSYRRMERSREFRLFIHNRMPVGMSQRHLERYYTTLAKRRQAYWRQAREFALDIQHLWPRDSLVADVYLTSSGDFILLDLNPWGGETDPLLFLDWDRDWHHDLGLKIVPRPVTFTGNIQVSF